MPDDMSNALPASPDLLATARALAASERLPYAGRLHPRDAHALFKRGDALLVDVRSGEERKFVGHVP